MARNRTFLTPPLGAYANGSCATMACFFRPLATCENGKHTTCEAVGKTEPSCAYEKLKPGEAAIPAEWRRPKCCAVPYLKAASLKRGEFSFAESGDLSIPPQWRGRGQFWYVAHLLAWLLRPNEATSAHVRKVSKLI